MILFSNMTIKDLPDYRKEKGLTQQQTADLMGTVQPAVARFEKGLLKGHVTSLGTLEKYVKALGLEIRINIYKPEVRF